MAFVATPLTGQVLRRLRLRHFELLQCLGEVATVGLAAERLNLSQPAVSKMIQEIEEVCGTRLFVRGRRGIEPNAQGRLLIRHADFLVRQLNSAGQQLDAMKLGASALLHVGASSTIPLLSRAIVHLRRQMPGLLVRIVNEPPRRLIDKIMRGELDCALAPLPPESLASQEAGGLRLEPVTPDRLCVVASSRHPLAQSRALHWADLVGAPWVLSPQEALTRQRFVEVYLKQGIEPPRPVIECVSFASIRWLLREDASLLALMRHHQASEEAAMGLISVLPVKPVVSLPAVSFITRRDEASDRASLDALLLALRRSLKTPSASS